MDDLLKTILGQLGIRLPGIGGVPEMQAIDPKVQEARDQKVLAEQANLPFPRRQMVQGIDAASDAVRGLNYNPIDPVPQDAGLPFKGAATLAAALPLFPAKRIPGMYSRVEKVAEALPEAIGSGKLWSILKNRTSKDELDWRRVPQIIQEGQPIKKEAVVSHLQNNPLDVTVKRLGDPPAGAAHGRLDQLEALGYRRRSPTEEMEYRRLMEQQPHATQYEGYQMPGAENYREDLIQLHDPARTVEANGNEFTTTGARGAFRSHHWEEPDILAHVRHNERNLPLPAGTMVDGPLSPVFNQDADLSGIRERMAQGLTGPRGRMIENIQSDWHQRGAHSGYVRDIGNGEGLEKIGGDPELSASLERATGEMERRAHALNNYLREPIGRHETPVDIFANDVVAQAEKQYLPGFLAKTPDAEIDRLNRELRIAQVSRDHALDAIARASRELVPDAPFKDSWAELALKQQLLDIAHNHPDLKWLGIAPQSELADRGEGISEAFQDVQLPRTLEKLLAPFGGKVEQAHILTKDIPHYSKPAYSSNPEAPYSREIMSSTGIPGSAATERQHIASTWPTRANERDTGRDVESLVDVLSKNRPELFEQKLHAPIARLTPEMLAQIREKGFPLLLALLAARQNMQPVASHQQGQ